MMQPAGRVAEFDWMGRPEEDRSMIWIKQSRLPITALGLAAIGFAAGCSHSEQPERNQAEENEAQRAWDMVAEAKRQVETLNVEEVAKEQFAGAVIVDLRESEERLAHGAIPGALHAPRGMLEFWADPSSPVHRPEFDPSRRLILHCAVGGRSALAAATLKKMGYANVAQLEGGFSAWRAAGNAVEPVTELSHDIVKVTGVRGDQPDSFMPPAQPARVNDAARDDAAVQNERR